jgi:dihydroorotate dehydrogenase electron transfer subunit
MIAERKREKRCVVDALVVACTRVCREHVALELSIREFPASEPGQFLELLCRATNAAEPALRAWTDDGFPSLVNSELSTQQPFLRRPFSIADRWSAADDTVRLGVISRTVGAGTRWLEGLKSGDTLSLTGPLGRGFRIPSRETPVVLIGGGVGLPPLLYLTRRLAELGHRDVTAIFGATTRDLLPLRFTGDVSCDGAPAACIEWPGTASFPTIITTDDGTLGLRGRVTDGLSAWHARRSAATRNAVVMACGPDAMLRAVARVTRERGLDCQLCIERNMGCGLGTCLSCVVRVRDAAQPAGWRWALACSEGPVFARDELLDYSA